MLVTNSSKEFKELLTRSRNVLIELVSCAIKEYGSLSTGFLQFAESISTKVVWQENIEAAKSPLEYAKDIFDKLSDHKAESMTADGESGTSEQIEQMLGDIKFRADITKPQYAAIASYLQTQIGQMIISINTQQKPLVKDLTAHCTSMLLTLRGFPDEHKMLRKKLRAENSNSEFVKLFESNFKSKSILLIDHLFFFFELFQKNLRETILENLGIWHREYELAITNIISRLDESTKYLNNQLKILTQVKTVCSSSSGSLSLTQRSQVVDSIEAVQVEMSKGMLVITGEVSKAIRFSFEFLEKTLNSLVKVFDALSTHSEMTLGDEGLGSEGEGLDLTTNDYFVIEGELLSFLKMKRDMMLGNQLIFETNFDTQTVHKMIETVLGKWSETVAPYLVPAEEYKDILGKIAVLNGAVSIKKMMSPEISQMVEVTDEDITMASTYKYSTRMNKGGVPNNGTIMLMGEFFVFFAHTLTHNINLLIPYRCIKEIKSTKNFIGKSNGLTITTTNGILEFFVTDFKERDQLVSRIQLSVDSLRHTSQTRLFNDLCFRNSFVHKDQNIYEKNTVPLLLKNNGRALCLRTLRKIRVAYLDSYNPVVGMGVANSSIFDLVAFWFGKEPFVYDEKQYDSFQHYLKGRCDCEGLNWLKSYTPVKLPQEATSTDLYSSFLSQSSSQQVLLEYTAPETGKVLERLTFYFSHADQIEVSIQATCSNKALDFLGLLVLSQGISQEACQDNLSTVYSIAYWKQGVKLFASANRLFGQDCLSIMEEIAQERSLSSEAKTSKYRPITMAESNNTIIQESRELEVASLIDSQHNDIKLFKDS